MRKASENLWSNSGFDAPLRNVVMAAQHRSATLALKSALGKLKKYGCDIENHLESSVRSLTESIERLQVSIQALSGNTRKVEELKVRIMSTGETAVEEINKKIDRHFSEVEPRIGDHIEIAIDVLLRDVLLHDVDGAALLMRQLRGDGKLECDDKEEFKKARKIIRTVYSRLATKTVDAAISSVERIVTDVSKRMNGELNAALGEMLDEAQHTLAGVGINVDMSVQDVEIDRTNIRRAGIRIPRSVESRIKGRSIFVTHELANFLDPFDIFGWGKEERWLTDDYFVIEWNETVSVLEAGLRKSSTAIHRHASDQVQTWQRECYSKLDGAKDYLDRYRHVLMDGVREREGDQQRAERIVESARWLRKKAEDDRFMVKALEEAVDAL